jgi:hypothetical protein
VFLPYCTGDVHTGNNVIVYQDPDGVEPDLEFHHAGHNNVIAATAWMDHQFPDIDRLFVTGCSAGGAGSLINYYFFRNRPERPARLPARRQRPDLPEHRLLEAAAHQDPLVVGRRLDPHRAPARLPDHRRLRQAQHPPRRPLPRGPPEHRVLPARLQLLALLVRELLRRPTPRSDIHQYWAADTDLLVDLYQTRDNLGYYLPYWRALNDSHCVSIASYIDTDIEELDMNLGDYIDELFNDNVPVGRYRESVQPGEDD